MDVEKKSEPQFALFGRFDPAQTVAENGIAPGTPRAAANPSFD
jgi:hypothetical protein